MKDYSLFTIPVEQAEEWTSKWQTENPKKTKAFLLPVEDLLGSLTEMGIIKTDVNGVVTIDSGKNEMVRTYLGIADDSEEKLLMVGTKNENGTYTDIINTEKEGNNSGIYNASQPCPPNCDTKSPLN